MCPKWSWNSAHFSSLLASPKVKAEFLESLCSFLTLAADCIPQNALPHTQQIPTHPLGHNRVPFPRKPGLGLQCQGRFWMLRAPWNPGIPRGSSYTALKLHIHVVPPLPDWKLLGFGGQLVHFVAPEPDKSPAYREWAEIFLGWLTDEANAVCGTGVHKGARPSRNLHGLLELQTLSVY